MADTIREQIIAAWITRASTLSTLPILRAQRSILETNDRFVSLWDGEDQAQGVQYGKQRMQFPLAVECIKKTTNHSTEANAIMGEIIARFLARTFTGKWLKAELAVASPGYPQDGGSYTTITIIFNITYETALGDPYTQATP